MRTTHSNLPDLPRRHPAPSLPSPRLTYKTHTPQETPKGVRARRCTLHQSRLSRPASKKESSTSDNNHHSKRPCAKIPERSVSNFAYHACSALHKHGSERPAKNGLEQRRLPHIPGVSSYCGDCERFLADRFRKLQLFHCRKCSTKWGRGVTDSLNSTRWTTTSSGFQGH
jgi:hypothetical protein